MIALAALIAFGTLPAPVAARPLDVVSDTSCPSATEIAARMATLFPPALFGAVTERVHVARTDQSIAVDLARADGVRIVARVLPMRGDCAEMAGAVAVVVVAWETELHPELLSPPELAAPPAVPAPPVPPPIATSTAPLPPPPIVRAPAPPPAPITVVVRPAPPPPSEPVEAFVMVGALASSVDGDWTGGARASAVVGRNNERLALATDLWGGRARTTHLGSGDVRWSRVGASIGPALRGRRGPWALVVSVQAMVTRLGAEGRGFSVNQESSGLLPGAVGSVSATRIVGRWFGWMSARALAWPLEPRVRIADETGAAATSREQSLGWLELDATVGLGVRLP